MRGHTRTTREISVQKYYIFSICTIFLSVFLSFLSKKCNFIWSVEKKVVPLHRISVRVVISTVVDAVVNGGEFGAEMMLYRGVEQW